MAKCNQYTSAEDNKMTLPMIRTHMLNSPDSPAVINHTQTLITYKNLYERILSIKSQLISIFLWS